MPYIESNTYFILEKIFNIFLSSILKNFLKHLMKTWEKNKKYFLS